MDFYFVVARIRSGKLLSEMVWVTVMALQCLMQDKAAYPSVSFSVTSTKNIRSFFLPHRFLYTW
jgi:hypothetical protein